MAGRLAFGAVCGIILALLAIGGSKGSERTTINMGTSPASGLGAQIAEFAAEAWSLSGDEAPPAGLEYGHLRVFCSQDADEIATVGATFSIINPFNFTRAEPFGMPREEFDSRMARLRAFTDRAHAQGITVISYVSANTTTHKEGVVAEAPLAQAWSDAGAWNQYKDFYGPRPAEPPDRWFEKKSDGSYGGHVWIPPWAQEERHYELAGCSHSPGFRQYLAGIMNILCEAGIDGIYLDHSEVSNPFSEDSIRCFQEFLGARYSVPEAREQFGIENLSEARPTDRRGDRLGAESVLFAAASGGEIHQYLRDHARQRDPDFIMSGNLYAADTFQAAVLDGSDIQLAAAVDTFLYSELASGQDNIPGTRDGLRVSAAPLNRMITASSRTGAATTYTHYPNSPNPIPSAEALYNIQRLATAEAFANHCAFRRIEESHDARVKEGAKSVYDLLRGIEPELLGAQMAANIGVVASLENVYHRQYSYHLEVSRALADAGFAHEMIAPRNLTGERLAHYRVVILPNTVVLGDDAYRALVEFAKGGGAVIGFGAVGTLDRRGNPGPAERLTEQLDYRRLPLDEDRAARDGDLGWDDGKVRRAAWGRGQWTDDLRPTMAGLVAAVEEMAGGTATARVHEADGVEITAMRRDGSDGLIVHLVNYGVDFEGEVTPARDVKVSVAVPKGGKATRVEWHALDGVSQTPEVSAADGRASFTVPELPVYGIAVVRSGRGEGGLGQGGL